MLLRSTKAVLEQPATGSDQAKDLLLQAIHESEAIIKTSTVRAEELIREATTISNDLRSRLDQVLTAAITEIQNITKQELNNIINQMAHEAKSAVGQMQKVVQAEQTEAAARTREQMATAIAEERARIQKKLTEKIPAIVAEVVGRSIPLVEHERLVKEALQRAEQEIKWL